jgi:hypothetical protein
LLGSPRAARVGPREVAASTWRARPRTSFCATSRSTTWRSADCLSCPRPGLPDGRRLEGLPKLVFLLAVELAPDRRELRVPAAAWAIAGARNEWNEKGSKGLHRLCLNRATARAPTGSAILPYMIGRPNLLDAPVQDREVADVRLRGTEASDINNAARRGQRSVGSQ